MVVLWVGTNNYEHTAEQVAGGILAIAELLTTRLPKAKIVVLVSLVICYILFCLFVLNSYFELELLIILTFFPEQ